MDHPALRPGGGILGITIMKESCDTIRKKKPLERGYSDEKGTPSSWEKDLKKGCAFRLSSK